MLARRNNDAEPRASLDVNVWIDTALTNKPELVQSMEQRRSDLGPLAYQHQRFRIPQSFCQRIDILDVIVPNFDFVPCHFFEAIEGAKRIVIVVKNGDLQFARRLVVFGLARVTSFIKATLARHPFDDRIVNESLAGNSWFSHKLEDCSYCFRFDAGDTVEIGYRVTVMLFDTLGRLGANTWQSL